MSQSPDKKTADATKVDPNMRVSQSAIEGVEWHDPRKAPFALAGFAWIAQEGIYRRLPRKPAHALPEAVDRLANHTAGGQARFKTDSPILALRVKLLAQSGMYHMPATGQCGFDAYMGPAGAQRYLKTTAFARDAKEYEATLASDLPRELREVMINFPLYQGVEEVLIGLAPGSQVAAPAPCARRERCIVYGTSITQGGCATRPGMAYTNILSRRLNMEFINLGFSGNGRGEPELARIIATIADPAGYVLDYEANARGLENIKATMPQFIRILREAQPRLPLLVMSRPLPSNSCFNARLREELAACRDYQRDLVRILREAGDAVISFFDGHELLGDTFDECTVDGAHPSDLGFMRMADALTPTMKAMFCAG